LLLIGNLIGNQVPPVVLWLPVRGKQIHGRYQVAGDFIVFERFSDLPAQA
jgi:hypothetical protein